MDSVASEDVSGIENIAESVGTFLDEMVTYHVDEIIIRRMA